MYRVFINYCVFFSKNLESWPPLPRQHSAAIGCTENYQPIGVTLHSQGVENFEGLLQRCRQFFLNTLYITIDRCIIGVNLLYANYETDENKDLTNTEWRKKYTSLLR